MALALASGCGASTPASVTYARKARLVAARDFQCDKEDLRIVESEMGVLLIEGCGKVASFRCSEPYAFKVRCDRATGIRAVAASGGPPTDTLASRADAAAEDPPASEASLAE